MPQHPPPCLPTCEWRLHARHSAAGHAYWHTQHGLSSAPSQLLNSLALKRLSPGFGAGEPCQVAFISFVSSPKPGQRQRVPFTSWRGAATHKDHKTSKPTVPHLRVEPVSIWPHSPWDGASPACSAKRLSQPQWRDVSSLREDVARGAC